MPKRVILIVLDGVGCGAMPDAERFGDAGSNTLGNVSRATPHGLDLPHLGELGLGNIVEIRGVPPVSKPSGAFGKAAEAGPAKDTTLGHWEIAGVIAEAPFPTYPNGFPPDIIDAFVKGAGVPGILGNKPASGTVILEELGAEHVKTRKPIVYTSADSVFQIACHEGVYPVEELYRQCQVARDILQGEHHVGRVIARPFVDNDADPGHGGKPGPRFKRTKNRRDFSVAPLAPTVLDHLKEAGLAVVGIGKIADIFAHQGLTEQREHMRDNEEGMGETLKAARSLDRDGLIFTNLVDTDALYGHRNDCEGFRGSLEAFDRWLPSLREEMGPDDLLVLTADHGIDPTTPSTDHSREYVPILVAGDKVRPGANLGTRATFADIAKTIDDCFGLGKVQNGESFLPALLGASAAKPEKIETA
jgi:phosphopentomutase